MRKKRRRSADNSEAWMLPYSDMLTLLLALFIVMFASAKVDDRKFQQISSEFGSIMALAPEQQRHKNAAGGSNAVELDSPAVISKEESSRVSEPQNKRAALKQEDGVKTSILQQNQEQQLKEIAKSLNETAAKMDLGKNTKASLRSDGLHLNLDSNILFESGSADLTESSLTALKQLAPKIQQLKGNEVSISGYTDDVPQDSKTYPSNWELSAARAVSVMHFFVEQKAVQEKNVSLAAFGENKPRATNSTLAGRSKNRRVELVIKKGNN